MVGAARPIRAVVADDDADFVQALAALLELDGGVEVVGVAANGEEAVQMVLWHDPDVVVLDVEMPRMSGIEATIALRQSRPRTVVLLVSGHDSGQRAREGIEAGAAAFVSKDRLAEALPEALLAACAPPVAG